MPPSRRAARASPGAPLVYRPFAPAAGTGLRVISGRSSPSEGRDSVPAGVGWETLADSGLELIVRALEAKAWRVEGPAGAAAALGLEPSTLYSRMKKLGIRTPVSAQALRGGQGEEP